MLKSAFQKVLAFTAAVILAGCSGSVVGPISAPNRPVFEGTGHGFGSGNFVPTDTAANSAATLFEMTAESDTKGGTGHGFGSGN